MLDKADSVSFKQVRDSRNRRIAGIFIRGDRYYGRLLVEDGGKRLNRRFPLLTPEGKPVRSVGEARDAFELLKLARRSDSLPTPATKPPGFREWVKTYTASAIRAERGAWTNYTEGKTLERWVRYFGDTTLDRISGPMVKEYIEARLAGTIKDSKGEPLGPVSARTVNLDLNALRAALRDAIEAGRLKSLPPIRNLEEEEPEEKRLLTMDEFRRLLDGVDTACRRNGRLMRFYLRFLHCTGCREKEALRTRWDGVDFEAGRLHVGADGQTKNGMGRRIEFNSALEALLLEMKEAAKDTSQYLFPSPRRKAGEDRPAKTMRESLTLAREAAGLPWLGFHHLRHFFASHGVMAGIDYMTIAGWLGHRDGGILVGKVYGHLNDEHKARMAKKLRI